MPPANLVTVWSLYQQEPGGENPNYDFKSVIIHPDMDLWTQVDNKKQLKLSIACMFSGELPDHVITEHMDS